MTKNVCWGIIIFALIVNVISLHYTIQSYYGLEYQSVYLFSAIGLVAALISISTFFYWRKLEYNK